MAVALVSLTTLMSLMLAWSGIAKVRDPESLRAAMGQLRVPAPFVGERARRLVPWGELTLAAILLITHGAVLVLGWAATLVLFLTYLALIVRAARASEPVSCNCFGSSEAPVTHWTVARNGLLATGAAIGLAGALAGSSPHGAALAGLGYRDWLGIGIVGVIGATAFVTGIDLGGGTVAGSRSSTAGSSTTLQFGSSHAQASDEDQVGSAEYLRAPIPVAVVEDGRGRQGLLAELPRERAVVLIYMSATCSPCLEVAGNLPRWAQQLGALDFVAVAYNQDEVERLKPHVQQRAVADVAGSVQTALHMDAVPSAAVLGVDGLLAGGPVSGTEDINSMMEVLLLQFSAERTGEREPAEPSPITD